MSWGRIQAAAAGWTGAKGRHSLWDQGPILSTGLRSKPGLRFSQRLVTRGLAAPAACPSSWQYSCQHGLWFTRESGCLPKRLLQQKPQEPFLCVSSKLDHAGNQSQKGARTSLSSYSQVSPGNPGLPDILSPHEALCVSVWCDLCSVSTVCVLCM